MKLKVLATVVFVFLIVGIYEYFIRSRNIIFLIENIEIFFTSIYLILFLIIGIKKKYKQTMQIRIYIMVHIFFVIIVIIFSSVLQPVLTQQSVTVLPDEAGERLISAYNTAVEMDDGAEIDAFVRYYNHHSEMFHKIDRDLITGIEYIPDVEEQQKYKITEFDFYTPWITSESVINMGKYDILFNIRNYIDRGFFYTAQVLLSYYQEIYGQDKDWQQVMQRIDQYVLLEYRVVPDYLRLKNYYNQMEYLYDIATKVDYKKEEIILANYILDVFRIIYKNTNHSGEIDWIQMRIQERLSQFVFFANDARINLFHQHEAKSITFVEQLAGNIQLWNAKDQVYIPDENAIYFKDLEILNISKENQEIWWHIKTPYAKMIGNTVYLNSIERSAIGIEHIPEVKINNTIDIVPSIITLDKDLNPQKVSKLQPYVNYTQHRTMFELFKLLPLWQQYFLPTQLLLDALIRMMVILTIFIISGIWIIGLRYQMSINNAKYDNVIILVGLNIVGIVPLQIIIERMLVKWLVHIPLVWQRPMLVVLIVLIITIIVAFVNNLRNNYKNV